jgi:hypothetical protein
MVVSVGWDGCICWLQWFPPGLRQLLTSSSYKAGRNYNPVKISSNALENKGLEFAVLVFLKDISLKFSSKYLFIPLN